MTEKRRWKEIDILRGMAILMVLLYHSIIVFPLNLHEIQWCSWLHTFLWTVQMPLFFLVSGFCYSYSGSYEEYVVRKCKRILVPHIVFSLLDILPRLLPNPLVNEQMDGKEAITDFLLYGGSDWFLWTLFVIVLVFPVFDSLCRKNVKGKAIAFIACVFIYACKPVVTDFLLFNMVSQYLLYYMLGYLLQKRTEILSAVVGRKGVLLPSVAGMVAAFAGFLAWNENRALELVCVLCSFVCFGVLAGMCRRRIAEFLVQCGTWSLQMYLLDAYALVATRTLLVAFLKITNPVAIIAGNFILDTGIVLFITCFILTKAKVFRVACGIPEKG